MAKINKDEYEILKSLDDKWKWIARDGECNSLNVFSVNPIKVHSQWDYMDVGYKHTGLTKEENKMFQFIKWEDESPYNIQELIEEYEGYVYTAEHFSNAMRKLAKALGNSWNESEETDVKKNIEWLRRKVLDNKFMGHTIHIDVLFELMDELDEPEVLSQEWIDEKSFPIIHRAREKDVVPVKDLQEILVPKQEEITEEKAWDIIKGIYGISNEAFVRSVMRLVMEHVKDDTTIGEIREKLESEVLSQNWIDEHEYIRMDPDNPFVYVKDLQNLLVPKQEEVDQAYKDGYEKGKQHTFYKGYLEGITDKGSEPETVADVVTTFWKSYERLKEVMSMEIEGM